MLKWRVRTGLKEPLIVKQGHKKKSKVNKKWKPEWVKSFNLYQSG